LLCLFTFFLFCFVGGGWTFIRNIEKALKDRAHFVDNVKDCDVMLVCGVTITNVGDVKWAKQQGKAVVLRVDNVPKKSRNRRQTPHERMKEIADMCDVVIYQSEWAKKYCEPLTGEGTVIYNGVDTKLFSPAKQLQPSHDRFLFAYHGKSELKGFWIAHAYFQRMFRENNRAEFWFMNDFGRELEELQEAKFDFWNGEKYRHFPFAQTPQQMAMVMQQCTHLLFPSVSDASPNTVLEARACGLIIDSIADGGQSGTIELLTKELDISLERMGDEYFGVLQLAIQKV